ncbi:universal stress protein [Candidatus Contubernalis alkaliaceticus]|uniref:universal stress protein n=1 Tax=Candidatus Contubernalis alkaliaceticus TaxID=338645 RepID=UPI001F4C211B|nr:universal stress protein [Candidatus Contubernalis alkalaceticus]UNC92360.1 universal stress protein [Candidatus Contubernalis alkalaceticus]
MKKILAPVDGSQNSFEALMSAKDMAEKFGGQLIILNIQKPASFDTPHPVPDYQIDPEALKRRGKEILDKAEELVKGTSAEVKTLFTVGDPADQILNLIEKEGADMVVMGSHGLSGIRRFLIGSVSNKVLQHSPKPVMVIK